MYGHLDECERCATFDMAIRRGLLVARNLPSIQPSADFSAKLRARLRENQANASWPDGDSRDFLMTRTPGGRILDAVRKGAAIAIVIGGLVVMHNRRQPYLDPHPATTTSTVAARPADRGASPARVVRIAPGLVAALTIGLPSWPAAAADRDGLGEPQTGVMLRTASLSP